MELSKIIATSSLLYNYYRGKYLLFGSLTTEHILESLKSEGNQVYLKHYIKF
jgi:hypothetical protein